MIDLRLDARPGR